jgi:hypothetical protein
MQYSDTDARITTFCRLFGTGVLPVALAVVGDEIVKGEAVMEVYMVHSLISVVSLGPAVREWVVV